MGKQVVAEVEEQLENFVWDTDESSMDFFGIGTPDTKEKPAKKEDKQEEEVKIKSEEDGLQKKEDDNKPKEKSKSSVKKSKDDADEKSKKEDEVEEKEEVEFFKPTEEVEEGNPEEDDMFFNKLASGLKEKGVLATIEVDEKEPLSEDVFVNSFENEIESRVQDTFEGFFEELDDDGKAFLKFKKEGGKTSDFFTTVENKALLPVGDISEENVQKAYLRYYYKNIERVDEEDIQDKLDWLEEGGKVERYAKKYKSIIDNVEKQKKRDLDERQAENLRIKEDEKKEFQTSLRETIKSTESLKDFPFTKKDKGELFTYITKPAVKVGKNRFITQFQKDLQDTSNNFEGLLLLAKLVKSDFNTSDLDKKVETRQTVNLRKKLQGQKANRKPVASGGGSKKSLSDFFN